MECILIISGLGLAVLLLGYRLGQLYEITCKQELVHQERLYRCLALDTKKDYQTLFNNMIDGFAVHEILCDEQGTPIDYRFLAINPAFENMTGLKADNILGRTVREILPDTESSWIEKYGQVALTGIPICFEQYSGALDRHYEVSAFCPGVGLFSCIFVDVTEQKQLEQEKQQLEGQLQRSQRLETMGALAGGLAHDFNNILTPISGYVEMALEDLPQDSQIHRDLDVVAKATNRAMALVQQMLTFSQHNDSHRSCCKLTEIVQEATEFIEHSLPSKIRLDTKLAVDHDKVLADSTQIYQVVINLCTNALHAMKDTGGNLEVSLREVPASENESTSDSCSGTPNYVALTVTDSGVGIAPDQLDRLFDPFYTTKGVGEGMGLGLSVVHGIVKGHDGQIHVESKLGQGTSVHVYFPIVDYREQETRLAQQCVPKGQETLLFVGGDMEIQGLEKRAFERLGYQVTTAIRSPEALALFRQDVTQYDLVVLEADMPTLNGLQLAQALLKDREDIPMILIAEANYTLKHEYLTQYGVDYVLTKPIAVSELCHTVRTVLDCYFYNKQNKGEIKHGEHISH